MTSHLYYRDRIELGTTEFDADLLRFAAIKGIGSADTLVIATRSLDVESGARWRLPDTDSGARYRVVLVVLDLRIVSRRTGQINRRGRFTFDGTGTASTDPAASAGQGRDIALFARLTFGRPVVECGGGRGAKGRRGVNGISRLWNGASPLRDEEGNLVTNYITGVASVGPPTEIPVSSAGGNGRPGGTGGAGNRARLFTTFNVNNQAIAPGGVGGDGGDGGRGGGQSQDAQDSGIPRSPDGAVGPRGADGPSGQTVNQKANGFEFMRLLTLEIGQDMVLSLLERMLLGLNFVRRRPGFWADEADKLSRALEDVDYLARTLGSTRNIGLSPAVASPLAVNAVALRSAILDRQTPIAIPRDAYVRPVPMYWRERAERQRALIVPALQMIAAAVQSVSMQELRRLILEQEARTIGYEATWLADELSTARSELNTTQANATRTEKKRADVQEKLRQRQQQLAIVTINFSDFLTLAAPIIGLFVGLIAGGPATAKAVTSGVSSFALLVKEGESGTLDAEKFFNTVAKGGKGLQDLQKDSKDVKEVIKTGAGSGTSTVPNWGTVADIGMTVGTAVIDFNKWIDRLNNAQFSDAAVKSLTVDLLESTKASLQAKAERDKAQRRVESLERRINANQQRALANAALLAAAPAAGLPSRSEIVALLREIQLSADIALTPYVYTLLAYEADTLMRRDQWLDLSFGHVDPDELDNYIDFADAARLSRALARSLWPAAHVALSGAIDLWRSTREMRSNGLDRLTINTGIAQLAAGEALTVDIAATALPSDFRNVRVKRVAIRLIGATPSAGRPALEFELAAEGDTFERDDALSVVRRTLNRDRLSVVTRDWSISAGTQSIECRVEPFLHGDGAPSGLYGRPLAGRWRLRVIDASPAASIAQATALELDFDYVYRDAESLQSA